MSCFHYKLSLYVIVLSILNLKPGEGLRTMKTKLLKSLIVVSFVVGAIFIAKPTYALSSTATVTADDVRVRSGAGTSYSILDHLSTGAVVNLLGTANDSDGDMWYKVSYYSGSTLVTGYMYSVYIQQNVDYTQDADFEAYLEAQGFPESYKVELRKLHALYPNWVFQAIHTGLDWATSVESEYGYNVSLTQSTAYGDRSTDSWSYDASTGTYKVFDGSSWYAASRSLIEYYLDPRNFLNVNRIFMFEKLTYSSTYHTAEAVSSILSDSVFSSYANDFVSAGASTNVSPIHLASRVIQEQGRSGSYTSSGRSFTYNGVTYSGYYNLFNINATSGSDNWINALVYAMGGINQSSTSYSRPWNSIYKSIVGGAMFLSESYIAKGQDTIYFQRFNVAPYTQTTKYRHQYMTNVAAASSEASTVYSAYNSLGLLGNSYVFAIPVFLNMPGDETPTDSGNTDNGNNNNVDNGNDGGNTNTTTIDYANELGWKNSDGYVSGIALNTSVDTITLNIKSKDSNANVNITTSSGASKSSSSVIGTGDKITIVSNGKTTTYTVVVYGDTSGDGKVNTSDLLAVQKHILGSKSLSGAFLYAASIKSRSTSVTTSDLLSIQKHILGILTIIQ